MIIVILMPETLSYLSCFAEPSMDTFSTFSQHFSQPRLLHGLQQWRRFPNTLALVVGVPPAGQQDQRAIPGSCSETPQRNLLTWVPRVIEKGGRGMPLCLSHWGFACHAIHNPDEESEVAMLKTLGLGLLAWLGGTIRPNPCWASRQYFGEW